MISMNDGVKFTIITVCFNSVETIERTMESVISQTFDNYEYIIIDGCSTDGTKRIIEKYKDLMPNKIKFVSEKDKGIYDAMNKGVLISKGDWIGFLNSDDWYEKETLEVVNNFIEKNQDADVVYGNFNMIYKSGEQLYKKKINSSEGFNPMKTGIPICHQSMFTKRIVFNKIGLFDLNYKIASDWDFEIRAYKNGFKYKYIDSVLVNFMIGGISSKPYFYERHKIRKSNNIYNNIDTQLIKDIFSELITLPLKKIIKNIFKTFFSEEKLLTLKGYRKCNIKL